MNISVLSKVEIPGEFWKMYSRTFDIDSVQWKSDAFHAKSSWINDAHEIESVTYHLNLTFNQFIYCSINFKL